jgi:anaerobic ribonucleoside-triphosphate reductase activating protein
MMSPEDIITQSLKDKRVEGITILGGEPFEQPESLAALLSLAWENHLSTMVFTGFTHEQLVAKEISAIDTVLRHTDVLIDGPYLQAQRDFSRPLVGSANQRFLFLTDRYTMRDFSPNRIEIRIGKDGTIALNGMGEMFGKNQESRIKN